MEGDFRAAVVFPEDAAALVSLLGHGATIRYSRRVVWREGKEEFDAGESYDSVAVVIRERINK